MGAIRDKAKGILEAAVPEGVEHKSNVPNGPYFKMTGYTQERLKGDWDAGINLTGCNAFTGWYGVQMGSTTNLGGFDLEGIVTKAGKPEAWTVSTRQSLPQYGDILRHASFHVDVAMGFKGGRLVRAAGGQGGKGIGYDIVKRVIGKTAYDFTKIVGWIDIDVFFGEASPSVPDNSPFDLGKTWLYGWWTVWDGNYYYYYFDPNKVVHYVKTRPTAGSPPPAHPLNNGTYSVSDAGVLVIDWNPLDGVAGDATQETFGDASDGTRTMHGTSNNYGGLIAIKIS